LERFSLKVLFFGANECLPFVQTIDQAKALSTLIKTLKFPCLSWKSDDSDWRDSLSLEILSDKSLLWFPKSSSWVSKV